MQIKLTQSEYEGYNIIEGQVHSASNELQRLTAARSSYVALLELKYRATYNPATNMLERPDEQTEE
ncbi:hypothetical protein CMI37_02755 [Candidatus Pacearchaeota archaeon]|nr:hypothetical protein [Candidatus Pacearchaeota archaeon]